MPPDNRPRRKREPVFIEYRFKWDGGWLFIALLAVGGFFWSPLLLVADLIIFIRC